MTEAPELGRRKAKYEGLGFIETIAAARDELGRIGSRSHKIQSRAFLPDTRDFLFNILSLTP